MLVWAPTLFLVAKGLVPRLFQCHNMFTYQPHAGLGAIPIPNCPLTCPLQTAMYTCISQEKSQLQWQFRNANSNTFVGAVAPTNIQPRQSICIEGIQFTVIGNESYLELNFTAEPVAEQIRVTCVDVESGERNDCEVKLASKTFVL